MKSCCQETEKSDRGIAGNLSIITPRWYGLSDDTVDLKRPVKSIAIYTASQRRLSENQVTNKSPAVGYLWNIREREGMQQ